MGGGGGVAGKVKLKLLLGLVEKRGEGLGKWGAIPLGRQTSISSLRSTVGLPCLTLLSRCTGEILGSLPLGRK